MELTESDQKTLVHLMQRVITGECTCGAHDDGRLNWVDLIGNDVDVLVLDGSWGLTGEETVVVKKLLGMES